jgi:hypothetical protein
MVFQCKHLQQSLERFKAESYYDGLNVTLGNPALNEPGLDLSKFRYHQLL